MQSKIRDLIKQVFIKKNNSEFASNQDLENYIMSFVDENECKEGALIYLEEEIPYTFFKKVKEINIESFEENDLKKLRENIHNLKFKNAIILIEGQPNLELNDVVFALPIDEENAEKVFFAIKVNSKLKNTMKITLIYSEV